MTQQDLHNAGVLYLEDAETLVAKLKAAGRTPVQSVSCLLVALSLVILDSEGPGGSRVCLSNDAALKLRSLTDAVAASRESRARDRAMGRLRH